MADIAEPRAERKAEDQPARRAWVHWVIVPAGLAAAFCCVFFVFGRLGEAERGLDYYLTALRSAAGTERSRAAFELARLLPQRPSWRRDERLAATLGEQLTELLASAAELSREDAVYCEYLAGALGCLETPSAFAGLAEAAGGGSPPRVRLRALLAIGQTADRLGRLDSGAAFHCLVQAASDGSPLVRRMAAFSLGATKRAEARPALLRLLADPDRDVRYNAAASLARLGDPSGRELLVEMLEQALVPANAIEPDQHHYHQVVSAAAIGALRHLLAADRAAASERLVALLSRLASEAPPALRAQARDLLNLINYTPENTSISERL